MARQTVLVVEDSEVEAQMLERGLRETMSRHAVVIVNTTTEADRYLFSSGNHEACPDLVMLDVRVPPEGGVELLRKMRSDKRTSSVPVVMLSGDLRNEDVEALYRFGANSYLDKPVDFQEFVSLIAATARYWLGLNLNTKQGR